jgi:hypothetical protein
MKRLIGAVVLVLAMTALARAHFIFIVPPAKGGRTVQVVFSDSTKPDKAKLLDKISHARFHLVDEKGKLTEAKAKKVGSALEIEVPEKGTVGVIGRCLYGVLDKGDKPFLLNYYARTSVGGPGSLQKELPAEAKQPLQIVLQPGKRSARVLWQGKPLAGAAVTFLAAKPVKTKTNKKGEVQVPGGSRAVLALHIEEKKGTYNEKDYSSVRHYATLVLQPAAVPGSAHRVEEEDDVPRGPRKIVLADSDKKTEKPAANPEATKLLADARAARANWDDFPGFTADVEVNVDGKKSTGKLTVSSKGKVSLDMKGDAKEWARRMIASIVGHRLDDSSDLKTPCAFADDVTDHPMGRAIRVLNDEYHSSYRIRDRQVIEVNRRMGESRFTISVLENHTNAEKKYLPSCYVVNTWSVKTGALLSSTTHHNTWRRVGKFDLPLACTIVNASADKLVNRTLKFSNHKLSEKKSD